VAVPSSITNVELSELAEGWISSGALFHPYDKNNFRGSVDLNFDKQYL
jgi:hypothetical protein